MNSNIAASPNKTLSDYKTHEISEQSYTYSNLHDDMIHNTISFSLMGNVSSVLDCSRLSRKKKKHYTFQQRSPKIFFEMLNQESDIFRYSRLTLVLYQYGSLNIQSKTAAIDMM